MRCPHCGSMEDKVLESRTLAQGESIRRRRECGSCGYRFTSYEKIEEKNLMVIKSSGRREPFDREKLHKGVDRALQKRNFSTTDIDNIVSDIEEAATLKGRQDHEITSGDLGNMVLEKLYKEDKVAYIRFASVYRNYNNVDEFIQEIENLRKNID